MEHVRDVIGFVMAWLDALGLPGLVLVGLFGLIFYLTRRRRGRRPGRKPAPVPEAAEGWWFTG